MTLKIEISYFKNFLVFIELFFVLGRNTILLHFLDYSHRDEYLIQFKKINVNPIIILKKAKNIYLKKRGQNNTKVIIPFVVLPPSYPS